ncbi:MAG: SprT family zinc-dependent metalloprotease [Candidatus Daviesbacteria bacterium]|nr:SprT family zinc-dependent metalloprotease [Candidatus Daviesbacteria bacterium]
MADFPTPNIIRSLRKTISLHISTQGELIVKAPFLIPEKLIHHFIKQKEDWIFKSLQKIQSRKISKKTYSEGEEFLFLGDVYKIHFGDYKEISTKAGLLYFPNFMKFRIQKELGNWFLKQAKEIITQRVDYMSKKMNLKYKDVRFSDTSSKWGSCGPDNALQFNWRLVMTPFTVINYVVVHELTHIIEKNHGVSFWIKVRLYTPAYKQHRKWLEANKHLLNV